MAKPTGCVESFWRQLVKIGDLIKHKKVHTTGVILDIFMSGHELEYRNEEWAVVLFSDDSVTSRAPLNLLRDNWEVISEI
jgi:hypothetical protein